MTGQASVELTTHRVTGEDVHGAAVGVLEEPGDGSSAVSPVGPTAPPPRRPPVDVLDADSQLVQALARSECTGPLWDQTAQRLAALGIGTLHALIRSGGLERESAALGRPIRLRPEELTALLADDHGRQEVVDEAVIKALDLFRRRTICQGVWTRDGGARLDTYFVNGCVMALANPVRAWLLGRRAHDRVDPWAPDLLDHLRDTEHRYGPDPADELLDREDTAAVLAWLGPVLGAAALLRIHSGQTWAEVAAAVGLSPKGMERRLRRFRDSHDPSSYGANHD